MPSFHRGAQDASSSLQRWLTTPITMKIDSISSCPIEEVSTLIGSDEEPVCVCIMGMEGTLTGLMVLAFDDISGLMVSDLLQGQTSGTSTAWCEIEQSSVLETMNIAGSAYLNGISNELSDRTSNTIELIPSPPIFLRDYAASILQSAFLDQAISGTQAVFAGVSFELKGCPLSWKFLLIPDASSLAKLSEILTTMN